MNKLIVFGLGIFLLGGAAVFMMYKKWHKPCLINTFADVEKLFPQTVAQIEPQVKNVEKEIDQRVAAMLAVTPKKRTFANTAQAYDDIFRIMRNVQSPLEIIKYVSPQPAVRAAAEDAVVELYRFSQNAFLKNKRVYEAFKAYVDGNARNESLSDEQRYYLQTQMRMFEHDGLMLPEEQLEQLKRLFNEIAHLWVTFDHNISDDTTTVVCTKQELAGVPESVVNGLARTRGGDYLVGVDYPAVFAVLKYAHDEQTRRRVYEAFENRAYPANYAVLKQLIEKRTQVAKLLGFDSYAAYEISNEMARTPAAVEEFLANVGKKIGEKFDKEVADLLQDLPEGVTLTIEGKLKRWDSFYVREQYKQKHLHIDDKSLTEYFPVDHVLHEAFDMYQQFLGLRFEPVKSVHLWHDSVIAFAVYRVRDGALQGYLVLDLYPRPGKYSHACELEAVPAQIINNVRCPAVICLITNFPRGVDGKPGLFKLRDVEVLFHELGHAMHNMVNNTHLFAFTCTASGCANKIDFIEMPSQMFERFVEYPAVLRRLSRHYKTGQPLPEQTIEALSTIERFDSGQNNIIALLKSLLSLQLYAQKNPDIDELYRSILSSLFGNHFYWDDASHFPANFNHLTEYGSRYYGYLWSMVFAADVFDAIKKRGGLTPEVGARLVDDILSKGSSVDPQIMLEKFLERAPTTDAFFALLGMKDA